MADKKSNQQRKAKEAAPAAQPSPAPKEKELEELLARARQVIKPIVTREAANEIVSDDLLNFRMKGCNKE